ncbi:PAS domain-containing protein, partial [Flavobacterium sp.]|uniref:PAS domain-containing protein n=1 Tax=Flavobacterium sp. TaxID=239 RepID=UPI002608EDDD
EESELLMHNFVDFVHPDDKESTISEARKVEKGSESYKFENRYLTKKGEIVWLSWYFNPIVEEQLIYATAIDISEQKKLRELNEQANNLARIGSWEIDMPNQKVYWSDEVFQLHETDKLSYNPTFEEGINFYREDFRPFVTQTINRCFNEGIPFDFEAVLVTCSKKEIWVRVIGKGEYANGICKRVYGSFQDINKLKLTEDRIFSLSNNLPGVVYQYRIGTDGRETVENVLGGIQQLWGVKPNRVSENLNSVWEQIKKAGDYDLMRSSIDESIKNKTRWNCRFRYVMPDGELKTHYGTGTPNFLADGTILYNSIILDVTEQVKVAELLNHASELAQIGSWEMSLLNQTDNQMYWSPMIKKILDVDEDYYQTMESGIHFCTPKSKQKIENAFEKLIMEGIDFDVNVKTISAKGRKKWVRCIGKSEVVNNIRTRIYGSLQDINESKIAEKKFKKLYREKNNILESIDDAFISIDKKWRVMYWNEHATKIFGINKEVIIGKQLWEEFPDLVKTKIYRQFNKVVALKKPSYFEIYYKKVDFWLEVSAYPTEKGLSVYFKNITSRKIADNKFELANERFEKVTEATKDAIWDWDIANDNFYRSKAVERFFGNNTLKTLHTKNFWTDRFHADDLENIKQSISLAIEDPSCMRWEIEYKIYNEDSKIIYVLDKGLIIRDKNGKATRMVGAMTDITELKEMTVQLTDLNRELRERMIELKRTNEELEQFAFVASHDLQEPLRMITSFMDLLERKYSALLDEKGLQYIYFATDGAKRMKQIILDLLDYSKANKTTEDSEQVDMNVVIFEYKKLRHKLIKDANAIIITNDLPVIKTYKAAISQIFHCILDNAIKYSYENRPPEINIAITEDASEWFFSITDNGIGIEPQFYEKIFVIFQRLHNNNQYSGTGIGLSIAKRHIEFLGGQIWVESKTGEGSTFYFKIPKTK